MSEGKYVLVDGRFYWEEEGGGRSQMGGDGIGFIYRVRDGKVYYSNDGDMETLRLAFQSYEEKARFLVVRGSAEKINEIRANPQLLLEEERRQEDEDNEKIRDLLHKKGGLLYQVCKYVEQIEDKFKELGLSTTQPYAVVHHDVFFQWGRFFDKKGEDQGACFFVRPTKEGAPNNPYLALPDHLKIAYLPHLIEYIQKLVDKSTLTWEVMTLEKNLPKLEFVLKHQLKPPQEKE